MEVKLVLYLMKGYDIENYYSLDDGNTWNEYNGPFQPTSTTVMAKSIKKRNGLSTLSTKRLERPTDALGVLAYDEDEATYVSFGDNNRIQKIAVADEMQGKNVYIEWSHHQALVQFLDKDDNEIEQFRFSNEPTIKTIPEGTKMIKFTNDANGFGTHIYEIKPENTPVISANKIYPKLAKTGVEHGYSEVTINYSATSVQKLYKIDNGEWQEYAGKLRLELNQTVYAKGMDKDGTDTRTTSSYKSVLPSDALGVLAYDEDEATYVSFGDNNRIQKIAVADEMQGKNVYIEWSHHQALVQFLDKDDNEIEQFRFSNEPTIKTIPEGTKMIKFTNDANNFGTHIYEIKPE